MRKGWRPSAVIFFKTGPNAFLLIAVAGLKSGKKQQCDIVLCALHRIRLPSTFQDIWSVMPSQYTEDESARPDRSPSLHHTRDAPDQSQCHGPQGRNPLGKISSEKNSCIWTLHPSGSPTSLTLFRLHRSSISVISRWVAPADPLNP